MTLAKRAPIVSVTLYGDPLQAETRTMHALLKMAGASFTLKVVDMTLKENKNDEYLKINPVGTIPAIETQETLVIGTSY